jgi:hypothetical protein
MRPRFAAIGVALFIGGAVCAGAAMPQRVTAPIAGRTMDPAVAPAFWQFPLDDDADDLDAFLLDGWLARAPGEAHVWIGDEANVGLTVARAGAFAATLEGFAYGHPRRLLTSVDGHAVGPADVLGTEASVTILPIGTLSSGPHQLRLQSLDGSDTADPGARRISIAVRKLTITRVGG